MSDITKPAPAPATDWEKYRPLIDKGVEFAVEAAKLTETQVDDMVVDGIRLLIERFLGVRQVRFKGEPQKFAAASAAALSLDPTVLNLILEIVKWIVNRNTSVRPV